MADEKRGEDYLSFPQRNLFGQGFDKGERMAGAGLQRALTLPMEGLPHTR